MNKTSYEEKWNELANIRVWMARQMQVQSDEKVRDCLFEARQNIGLAMLHLEQVEYRIGGAFSCWEDKVE